MLNESLLILTSLLVVANASTASDSTTARNETSAASSETELQNEREAYSVKLERMTITGQRQLKRLRLARFSGPKFNRLRVVRNKFGDKRLHDQSSRGSLVELLDTFRNRFQTTPVPVAPAPASVFRPGNDKDLGVEPSVYVVNLGTELQPDYRVLPWRLTPQQIRKVGAIDVRQISTTPAATTTTTTTAATTTTATTRPTTTSTTTTTLEPKLLSPLIPKQLNLLRTATGNQTRVYIVNVGTPSDPDWRALPVHDTFSSQPLLNSQFQQIFAKKATATTSTTSTTPTVPIQTQSSFSQVGTQLFVINVGTEDEPDFRTLPVRLPPENFRQVAQPARVKTTTQRPSPSVPSPIPSIKSAIPLKTKPEDFFGSPPSSRPPGREQQTQYYVVNVGIDDKKPDYRVLPVNVDPGNVQGSSTRPFYPVPNENIFQVTEPPRDIDYSVPPVLKVFNKTENTEIRKPLPLDRLHPARYAQYRTRTTKSVSEEVPDFISSLPTTAVTFSPRDSNASGEQMEKLINLIEKMLSGGAPKSVPTAPAALRLTTTSTTTTTTTTRRPTTTRTSTTTTTTRPPLATTYRPTTTTTTAGSPVRWKTTIQPGSVDIELHPSDPSVIQRTIRLPNGHTHHITVNNNLESESGPSRQQFFIMYGKQNETARREAVDLEGFLSEEPTITSPSVKSQHRSSTSGAEMDMFLSKGPSIMIPQTGSQQLSDFRAIPTYPPFGYKRGLWLPPTTTPVPWFKPTAQFSVPNRASIFRPVTPSPRNERQQQGYIPAPSNVQPTPPPGSYNVYQVRSTTVSPANYGPRPEISYGFTVLPPATNHPAPMTPNSIPNQQSRYFFSGGNQQPTVGAGRQTQTMVGQPNPNSRYPPVPFPPAELPRPLPPSSVPPPRVQPAGYGSQQQPATGTLLPAPPLPAYSSQPNNSQNGWMNHIQPEVLMPNVYPQPSSGIHQTAPTLPSPNQPGYNPIRPAIAYIAPGLPRTTTGGYGSAVPSGYGGYGTSSTNNLPFQPSTVTALPPATLPGGLMPPSSRPNQVSRPVAMPDPSSGVIIRHTMMQLPWTFQLPTPTRPTTPVPTTTTTTRRPERRRTARPLSRRPSDQFYRRWLAKLNAQKVDLEEHWSAAHWTSWSSWSPCNSFKRQYRKRQCHRKRSADICDGRAIEMNRCAYWKNPNIIP